MSSTLSGSKNTLPDISVERVALTGKLAQVGMGGIAVPVQLVQADGRLQRAAAVAEAFVSLDNAGERGIHMSRLFRAVQDSLPNAPLDFAHLTKICGEFLTSHATLSESAFLSVQTDALVLRPALKTQNAGWRSYPVRFEVTQVKNQPAEMWLEVTVTYSSTCPMSAALARQLIQQQFAKDFSAQSLNFEKVSAWLGSTDGIVATPHAQRSFAKVRVQLSSATSAAPTYLQLIDLLENTLQTPVQTVVKREDEQEFALRNGQNLMFCEDAARKVQSELLKLSGVKAFSGEFRHAESLHAHDAISRIRG